MTSSQTLKLAAVVFILALALPFSAAAVYTAPQDAPPICNAGDPGCESPVHTGAASQEKSGGLGLGGVIDGAVNKLVVWGNSLFRGATTIMGYMRLVPTDIAIETGNVPNGVIYYKTDNPDVQLGIDGGKFRCRENGEWVNCIGGGTSDSSGLWETDPQISNGIKNKNAGTVRVGVFDAAGSTGYGAVIGGANGIDAYVLGDAVGATQQNTTAAANASHSGAYGVGIIGHAYGTGVTYGSKSISSNVGAFNRGRIGLYATNQGDLPDSAVDDGWFVPNNVLAGPSYAAVVNGPMWVADTVRGGSASENPDTNLPANQLSGAGVVIAQPDAQGAASGLEAYTTYATKGALTGYATGDGVVGIVSQANGTNVGGSMRAFGAKSLSNDIGSLLRGNTIGLYATNKPGISYLTTDTSKVSGDTVLIPNTSYAGYFDGPVNITGSTTIEGDTNIGGDVNIAGDINFSPLSQFCVEAGSCDSITSILGGSGPWKKTGTNVTLNDAGDAVGIGETPSDGYKLDVVGTIYGTGLGVGGNTRITGSLAVDGGGAAKKLQIVEANFGSAGTLDVYDVIKFSTGAPVTTFALAGNNTDTWLNAPSGALHFGIGGADAMRVSSGGNVGVGLNNPSAKIHISNNYTENLLGLSSPQNTWFFQNVTSISGNTGEIIPNLNLKTTNNNKSFSISGNEGRAVAAFTPGTPGSEDTSSRVHLIPNGGSVGINGDASDNFRLVVHGNSNFVGTVNADAVNNRSDARLKTNIVPVVNALDIIKKLVGVKFDWKKDGKKDIGVIAQEVEKVLPELVTTGDDGIKSVNYNGLTPVLIQAVKEQQKQIESLQAQIDELKAAIK